MRHGRNRGPGRVSAEVRGRCTPWAIVQLGCCRVSCCVCLNRSSGVLEGSTVRALRLGTAALGRSRERELSTGADTMVRRCGFAYAATAASPAPRLAAHSRSCPRTLEQIPPGRRLRRATSGGDVRPLVQERPQEKIVQLGSEDLRAAWLEWPSVSFVPGNGQRDRGSGRRLRRLALARLLRPFAQRRPESLAARTAIATAVLRHSPDRTQVLCVERPPVRNSLQYVMSAGRQVAETRTTNGSQADAVDVLMLKGNQLLTWQSACHRCPSKHNTQFCDHGGRYYSVDSKYCLFCTCEQHSVYHDDEHSRNLTSPG